MEKIVSLCKRRGFIFQGSEIYGGLAGTFDYGPLGSALKNNVKNSWIKKFVRSRDDMYLLDAAILMNAKVWEISGHVAGFTDPLVECKKCKKRFRADQIAPSPALPLEKGERREGCPECKGEIGAPRQFNMMMKTNVGALEDSASVSYLRPETAQGIFVNFKNVMDSVHPKLPFGIAQVGKAFRNEITPRDFIFRSREFEQMEIEYFVKPDEWQKYFEYWKDEMAEWMETIGLDMSKVHDIEKTDLAHYSKRTVDFEFEYPFGQHELYGLAYRTDFDLKSHEKGSGESLGVLGEEGSEKFIPHVIEPSFGVDRTILALLLSAYREDEMNDEKRVYLALKPALAPFKIAVFPLLRNRPELVEKARHIYAELKAEFLDVQFDDNGNIGKRYRRQDEIGTPYCVTVDFDTLKDAMVTVRDRDSGKQERVKVEDLIFYLLGKINS